MTEFAVTLPVFLVMLLAVFYLGECVTWWQRMSMAARYSAWRYARETGDHESNLDEHQRYFFGHQRASYQFSKGMNFECEGLPPWLAKGGGKLLGFRSCRVEFTYELPSGMRLFHGEPMVASHTVCGGSWPRRRTGGLPCFIKKLIAE